MSNFSLLSQIQLELYPVHTSVLNLSHYFYTIVNYYYNFGNFLYLTAATELLYQNAQALVPQTLLKCDIYIYIYRV
jgi:hypothetical protein